MRALISYYGGKQNLASRIVSLIPAHDTYCEPFCGGAAVFWEKRKSRIEILNDWDERLITFYRVFQDEKKSQELIHRLKFTPYSEAEHKLSKKILKNPEDKSEIERAWAYFVNIHQSFSNVLFGSWAMRENGESPTGWRNKIEMLHLFFKRLKGVEISCRDAISVIEQYDSPTTFFYLDPPYPETDQGHYKGYTLADFQKLIDCLQTIKGAFILSNYNQGIEMPDHWEKFEIKTWTFATKAEGPFSENRRRTEILWRYVPLQFGGVQEKLWR